MYHTLHVVGPADNGEAFRPETRYLTISNQFNFPLFVYCTVYILMTCCYWKAEDSRARTKPNRQQKLTSSAWCCAQTPPAAAAAARPRGQ